LSHYALHIFWSGFTPGNWFYIQIRKLRIGVDPAGGGVLSWWQEYKMLPSRLSKNVDKPSRCFSNAHTALSLFY
jgi:hypothetical protein